MKFLFSFLFAAAILTALVSGQCPEGPKEDTAGPVLKRVNVKQTTAAEVGLSIRASVKGASWQTTGAEAAEVTVFVDGKYNQDVILYAGSRIVDYKFLIGRLEAGRHNVALVLNKERSAKNIGNVRISSVKTFLRPYAASPKAAAWEEIALANSPFIYVRPGAVDKFSDIPLITYYEILFENPDKVIVRYSTIFTNEDGGTQTMALMARWGRATDIEWVYERSYVDGKLVSETLQGANHQVEHFDGTRVYGGHPLIYDVTVNNNFSDTGCSSLRLAPYPVRADLAKGSRETIMDENPWTYRIMAEEAVREGRVDPKNMGVNIINDPRNYIYVEVYTENNGTAVSIEAEANGKVTRSDFGHARLRMGRSGFQRIAVLLASPASTLNYLSLSCHSLSDGSDQGSCGQARIVGYMTLDKNYIPIKTRTAMKMVPSLKPGEKAKLNLKRQSPGRLFFVLP